MASERPLVTDCSNDLHRILPRDPSQPLFGPLPDRVVVGRDGPWIPTCRGHRCFLRKGVEEIHVCAVGNAVAKAVDVALRLEEESSATHSKTVRSSISLGERREKLETGKQ